MHFSIFFKLKSLACLHCVLVVLPQAAGEGWAPGWHVTRVSIFLSAQKLLCSHVGNQVVFFSPYSMAAARAAKHPGSCILQVGEGGTEGAVDPGTSIFIPFTCTFPRTPADTTKGLCHIFAWLPISTSSLLCTQMSSSPIQEVIKVASPTQEVFKVAFPTQEVVQWLLWMSLRIPG